MKSRLVHGSFAVALLLFCAPPFVAGAQNLPLSPPRESGQTVTPAFEGWYKNPDGSFSLSFGYLNRNEREVVNVPIGRNNFVTLGDSNRGQPTSFQPGRHWGVFAVKVPADFGDKQVVWTLSFRGQTYAIPGSLKRGWEIDAIEGEGTSGNVPPTLKFEADGAVAQGPLGAYGKPLAAKVGTPLTIEFWAADEPGRGARGAVGGRGATTGSATGAATGAGGASGAAGTARGGAAAGGGAGAAAGGGGAAAAGAASGSGAGGAGAGAASTAAAAGRNTGRAGRGSAGPTLAWFKHQGPGDVTFSPAAPRVDAATGKASVSVTFNAPGEYVLRLRANDSAVASAGHAQCCWTNGFIKVTVSR